MTYKEIEEKIKQYETDKRILNSCNTASKKIEKLEDRISRQIDMFCLENDIGNISTHPKEIKSVYNYFGKRMIDELNRNFIEVDRMEEKYGEKETLNNHRKYLKFLSNKWKEYMNSKPVVMESRFTNE